MLKDFRTTCQLVGLLIKFFDLSSFVDCPLEPCRFQIMYRALIRVLNLLRELEVGLQIRNAIRLSNQGQVAQQR